MGNESKKEAFRKYLEASGVLESLTKVLVGLYEEPERPAAAVDYLRSALGGPSLGDVEQVKAQRDKLQLQVAQLQAQYVEACKRIEELEAKAR